MAFTGVALLAVALVVGLVVVSTSRETASLAASERRQTTDTAAAAAATAYRDAGGWTGADLSEAQRIARRAGGRLVTLDARGRVVSSGGAAPGSGGGPGAGPGAGAGGTAATAPVRVAGVTVGRVVFRVPGSGLTKAEQRLRDRLVTIALIGGGLAVAIALGAALLVARRLTAPLRRLTGAARALESGEPQARAGIANAPGEIGELSRAFDRLAQTLADQADARQALLAEIAHELRTPLAILRGNCEAMVDGVERPTPERLSSLHDEVLRLEGLVTDLETLAASEAASLRLEPRPVDLAGVARDALTLLDGRAAAAGVRLASDLTGVVAQGDRARLTQILENLLSNALKFTPAGGTITVTVARAGDRAIMEVRDTGRGIPAGEVPHVFERHWRGSAAADTSGRGIGLAVVDELVRAHHGTVSVSSEVGRGSRFTVTLPAL